MPTRMGFSGVRDFMTLQINWRLSACEITRVTFLSLSIPDSTITCQEGAKISRIRIVSVPAWSWMTSSSSGLSAFCIAWILSKDDRAGIFRRRFGGGRRLR